MSKDLDHSLQLAAWAIACVGVVYALKGCIGLALGILALMAYSRSGGF